MSLFSKVLKYVWPQLKKSQWIFYLVVFLYLARIFLDFIVLPVFFKQLIDLFSSENIANSQEIEKSAFRLFYIIISFHVSIFFIARFIKFTYYRLVAKTVKELRNFTFQKIEHHSYTFFSNIFSGSLVTKARRFVGGFENAFDVLMFSFLKFIAIVFGSLIILVYQMPLISIIFGIWVVLNIGIMFLLLRTKIKYDILEAEQDSKISGRLADVFGNILAVKFFSAEEKEKVSFSEYTREGEKRSLKASFLGGKMDMIQHLLIVIIEVVITYILIVLWLQGKVSVGTIVLVETYLVLIAGNLWDLSGSMVRFMRAFSDMKEMVDIFDQIPDILDVPNPEKLRISEGQVSFKNVNFEYVEGLDVFKNFNLDIKSGEKVGLVGHSGSGKSTITKMLLRFIDIKDGEILIDGQNIAKIKQDDLRSKISYVPQESILFHRSIKENIAYSKSNATDDEVIEAAKKAHAHEFISTLPNGYDTLVGERGVKLSGGERQRVAIARVMLKDAPILVLDEATSSLDSISESYIQDAFNELMKGKTTLVIAHRLSTVQKMDRIIVLDKGKIVEEGTHKELLEKNGFYADLWNHQTGGFLE
ncbi:ABC transporter ATP-binding protein [Candidatus Nomurabacteria bacterium]|nr:ABC transporter ATP-binding protein [Candidatus Nomurabacteria bacterium]